MLYRLAPHSNLEWTDFPAQDVERLVSEYAVDLDKFEWKLTEDRMLSTDLLRIALRHGVPSRLALVVAAVHTVDLGRSEALRASQQELDELQSKIRDQNGALMEAIIPGWTSSGRELDERVRASTEKTAAEADQDLADVLAAPIRPNLTEHWIRLGGSLPDPL